MKTLAKAAVVALAVTGIGAFSLVGCAGGQAASTAESATTVSEASNASSVVLENCTVSPDTSSGTVFIDISPEDFNKLGFAYGDSVSIAFSNGYKLENIPYYNGYYVNVDDPLLVAYPGTPHIKAVVNYGEPLWKTAGLSEGDTATVTLNQTGAFLSTQETFDIAYTNERSDYASDKVFANFRALSGGTLKPNAAYRSASPICNDYNRASYVEDLMKQAGVAFVLDLSDNEEKTAKFVAEATEQGVDVSYFERLRESGCVAMLGLSASYPSQELAEKLVSGLVSMSQHDGPYLIHCIEGKDRTGFVCALLEALCGASYDEMLADYMVTYANYYGITKESEPGKYQAIASLNLDGMLRFLAKADEGADLTSIDYTEPARDYLRSGGMTDEQIDALVARLKQ